MVCVWESIPHKEISQNATFYQAYDSAPRLLIKLLRQV